MQTDTCIHTVCPISTFRVGTSVSCSLSEHVLPVLKKALKTFFMRHHMPNRGTFHVLPFLRLCYIFIKLYYHYYPFEYKNLGHIFNDFMRIASL